MVEAITNNPFIPMAFQKDHSGMQGTEYFEGTEHIIRRNMWLDARWRAIEEAKKLAESGVTKQLCNRPLEAYMWHTVIITATEWENFFALRCPQYRFITEFDRINNKNKKIFFRSKKDVLNYFKDDEAYLNDAKESTTIDWLKINKGQAEIHMMAVAEAMWDAYNESKPKELQAGEWHLPYGDEMNDDELNDIIIKYPLKGEGDFINRNLIQAKISTARCARVSYTVIGEDGKEMSLAKLVKLHDEKLINSRHWSPFEHSAQAMSENDYWQPLDGINTNDGYSGNFNGFIQYRKQFKNENIYEGI
jgi:hypothetical protein